jgi:uncharacterized membrane protein
MRKAVVFILLGLVGVALLIESGIFEALTYFLLAGVIPGTNFAIPSTAMFLVLIGLVWLVFFRFIVTHVIQAVRQTRSATARKKRMPKRRFSQI